MEESENGVAVLGSMLFVRKMNRRLRKAKERFYRRLTLVLLKGK
jgi:hypothetical protein